MRFSVIITVYNAHPPYLRECLDSVLRQTHEDVEIIIIDDGSTAEDTLTTLAEYESKPLSIHHKPNGGQGSARNAGMALASGDYWLFLDSDDYYLLDSFLAEMSLLLEESQADMCSFQYVEFFSDADRPTVKTGSLRREKVYKQPPDLAIKTLLSAPRQVFSSATHTKALRGAFMRENHILAPEGVKNEDISLTARIIRHAKTYDRYDKAVYAYRRANVHSISATADNSFSIAHDVMAQFQTLLSNETYKNDRNVLDFLASPYIYWMGKIVSASQGADGAQKPAIKDEIRKGKEFAYLLKHSSRLYVRCVYLFIRSFGTGFTLFLLRLYLTINRQHMLSLKRKMK